MENFLDEILADSKKPCWCGHRIAFHHLDGDHPCEYPGCACRAFEALPLEPERAAAAGGQ